MSALDELRSGAIGDDFVALLRRTVRAVAPARGFPPPEGYDQWVPDAVTTAVDDFLSSPQTPRRLTDLATHCQTDDAVRRRLQEAVANHFADIGRRTPLGRLVLRVNEVLKTYDAFERRGAYWALAGDDLEVPVVDLESLAAALASVEVVVPTAWTTGDRQSPDADAPSIRRLAEAALTSAQGPLRASDIAHAVAIRLGLGRAPLSIEAMSFEPPAVAASADSTGNEAIVTVRAHQVCFEALNDAERLAIGRADLSVGELGPLLAVSRSKAALIRKRAVTILQNELGTEDGGQEVADLIFQMAKSWAESWKI